MTGITLIPSNGFDQITEINCGTSTPKLSGSIDLSLFPSLINFTCINNDITSINGINAIAQLRTFSCQTNLLAGSIPSLVNNTQLQEFTCQTNEFTGSIPNINTNTQLQVFRCSSNRLSGSIPNLNNLLNLVVFRCDAQKGLIRLTSSIPSISANTLLQDFRCNANQLTGFAGGSVSNTLGDFQAQANQLPATAVNSILAAFVAANRTSGTRILNLGGTGNAAPTGQGLIDKQTLIDRGWTVTTN
jgi:Leucine-rich repeat (LRR) protein